MREIKFRAWHKDTQKVIPIFNLLSFSGDGSIWVNENKQHPINTFHGWIGKDFELMQYTGLKDKNDVEIYDGDIIRIYLEEKENIDLKIEFQNGSFSCFYLKKYAGIENYRWGNLSRFFDIDMMDIFSKTKVIGNIYENRELLE